ncbi:MAG: hypothetical protein Kow0068_08080 [Marinilabiliales bacterium]
MKKTINISLAGFIAVLLLLSCNNTTQQPAEIQQSDSLNIDTVKEMTNTAKENINIPQKLYGTDTTITLFYNYDSVDYSVKILIRFPKDKITGTILALHGWNLPYTDWCTKTRLCDSALKKGYIIILPDMGKSSYTFEIYPETRKDWAIYPTVTWLIDSAFNYIQKNFKLLLPGQNNYVLGLSTGGRGSALLALLCPDIFKACATLSGDFDQTQLINDPIYNGFYGSYKNFPQRWKDKDNMVIHADEYKIPLYIGHGLLDNVCPAQQSIMFYDTLKLKNPDLKVVLHIDSSAVHDYNFWNSEVINMLNFFESSVNQTKK